MMRLIDLPILGIAIFTSIIFILFALLFVISIYFYRSKKHLLFALSIILNIPLILIFVCVSFEMCNNGNAFTNFFVIVPFYIYIIYLVVTFTFLVLSIIFLQKWYRNNITSDSFMDAFDKMEEGVLYFDDDGICLLINSSMITILEGILSHNISNAYDFFDLLNNQIITTKEGKTYKFISSDLSINRRELFFIYKKINVHELIAFDITDLSNANKQLQIDNEKILLHNQSLMEYNKNMQNIIRNKEILSAKIRIHDEMNNLLLKTSYLLTSDDIKEKKEILNKRKNNILLLCKEASSENEENIIDDLLTLANGVGVSVTFHNYQLLKNEEVIKLFINAAKESILNVAKHTKSKQLNIDVKLENGKYYLRFINDNSLSKNKPVSLGGGLKELQRHVNSLNGIMYIKSNDQFILTIEVDYVV